MRYVQLGNWVHGVSSPLNITMQMLDPEEAALLRPDVVLPVHGFMLLPLVNVPHGPVLTNLFAHGVESSTSCAVKAGIEALTAPALSTGCQECRDISNLVGIVVRLATSYPEMLPVMNKAIYTVLKYTISREGGFGDEVAEEDDYNHSLTLPINSMNWMRKNFTPEMIQYLSARGLL